MNNDQINSINKNVIIRKERPEDYKTVEYITMRAFWNIHGEGCCEHLLVRALRDCGDYLPDISRVAEIDGKVVGAIYYSKSKIIDGDTEHNVVTFGPVAVEPTLFGRGIGSALLNETIGLARESGYPGIVICGEPYYYPKFGFRNCEEFGISDANGNNYPALMCLPLNGSFSDVHGRFIESPVFEEAGADEEALKRINAEFPDYPKVAVKDGFYEIFDKHIGRVISASGGEYVVKYWELSLKARLSPDMNETPRESDNVLFKWKAGGGAEIVEIIK